MHKTCTVPSSDIIVFGEVLFDIFSSADKVIGGAPFNVARHLAGFGLNPCFVSSTGNDGNGRNALDLMKKWDMKTRFVSVRDGLPTGTVNVSIIDGEPSYKIKADQAYDRIEMPVNGFKSPILYHGTLALRSPHNLKIVKQIKSRYRPFTFTDMNLRKPWYSKEIITYALESSFCVKMNRLELGLVAEMFQINSNDVPGICRELVSLFHVNEMIVTMAEKGAWWIHPNGTEFTAAAAPENFIDSVGAGDAFSAAALRGIALNRQRKETLQLCTDFAARVCGIKGAVPQSDTFYNEEACGKKGGSP